MSSASWVRVCTAGSCGVEPAIALDNARIQLLRTYIRLGIWTNSYTALSLPQRKDTIRASDAQQNDDAINKDGTLGRDSTSFGHSSFSSSRPSFSVVPGLSCSRSSRTLPSLQGSSGSLVPPKTQHARSS